MMATSFLGYTLPWGQMSYWGATVITNLFSAIPLVGDGLKTWILGDYTVGNATLNRFFALHYVLPFVILGVVGLHVVAVHVHGSNNPAGIDIKSKGDTVSFFPYMIVKDTLAVCVCGVAISVIIFFGPNLMAEVDNYIPADPLVTPSHIVANWYLAPFYAILRAIPDKLGGVVLMFAAILILFVLPWLDTSKTKSCNYRPVYKWFMMLFFVNFFVLGFGYGRMWNKNYGNFEKYKLFGGIFLLGSYDYVNFNNEMINNNHFGLFGVYPLMLNPRYDMMKL